MTIGRTVLPPFEELATFVIALVVLVASFYGLLREGPDAEARVIYGGLIASVATYYFQRSATKLATQQTIAAQNNGLDQVRQTVARIENGRAPTEAERLARDKTTETHS